MYEQSNLQRLSSETQLLDVSCQILKSRWSDLYEAASDDQKVIEIGERYIWPIVSDTRALVLAMNEYIQAMNDLYWNDAGCFLS